MLTFYNVNERLLYIKQLLMIHGFGHVPVQLNNTVNTLASIRYIRNKITRDIISTFRMSKHAIQVLPNKTFYEIILHEIAHLKAGLNHQHDNVWKMHCYNLGIRPERTTLINKEIDCYLSSKKAQNTIWIYLCPECNRLHKKRRGGYRVKYSTWICRCGTNFKYEKRQISILPKEILSRIN